jgi:hypothetical protein
MTGVMETTEKRIRKMLGLAGVQSSDGTRVALSHQMTYVCFYARM